MWQAIFDLVKNISEVLLSSLPNFWKISKNFIDGKYKKVGAGFLNPVDLYFILSLSCNSVLIVRKQAKSNSMPYHGA